MSDNQDMNSERNADRLVSDIKSHLLSGGVVAVCTALRVTYYTKPQHADLFEVRADGPYVRAGKRREHIGYCAIKFGRMVAR